ncbi:DMT family transporter [Rossellomorea marisflavi]|uniref:EamA family transporter n=1 Tax=Rossellomorea marisflavi TaxID=189381 RepID=UPI0027A873E9|nr:DMT family transporter [Rossellomorea marisflavi]UTE72440.1 DMT family transporter [Rossellomorea marisflavi]
MKSYRASLCVLIGASSYGIHASVVKLGLGQGYSVPEITGLQYLFGLVMLFAAFLFTRKVKMTAGQVAALLGVGVFLSLTGIFYGMSLSLIPASIAVVMLFQFTWIGVLIEALYIRKLPSKKKLVSVLFLWIGTLFAGGLGSSHGFDWTGNSLGLLYGFGAAVTFALFMFFSGKAARSVPTFQKSMIISLGGILVVLAVFQPSFIHQPSEIVGMADFGLLVAIFGNILPVVFFAIGTPHLDSSMSTIMGAAELPAAILAAMWILHEQVAVFQFAGIVLILAGIIIPQIQPGQKKSFS